MPDARLRIFIPAVVPWRWRGRAIARQFAAGVIAFALASGGCGLFRRPPAPATMPAPRVNVSVSHFAGSPLSGAIRDAALVSKLDPVQATFVRLTIYSLEKLPVQPLPTVGSRARLIYADRGGLPVRASARLLQSSQIFDLNDANDLWTKLPAADIGRVTPLGAPDGVVGFGTTLAVAVAEPEARLDLVTGAPARRGVEFYLHRPADAPGSMQLAIAVTDRAADASAGRLQRELAMIDLGAPAALAAGASPGTSISSTFGLLIPFKFDGSPAAALAVVCQTGTLAADDSGKALLAGAEAALVKSAARSDGAAGAGSTNAGHAIAFAATGDKDRRREAIAFLAADTDAVVCQDVALVADDPAVEALVAAVRAALPDGTANRAPAALGWTLDEVALRVLHENLAGGSIAPELSAALVRHAGEVGRSAASLEAVLKGVRSREEFDARLVAENRIYLEDTSPGARVRAFDWLAAKNQSPEGFDPLAPSKQRRAALEKSAAPLPADQPIRPASGGLP